MVVVGFTAFAINLLINYILTFILPPRKQDVFMKASFRFFFKLLFIKVKVKREEHVPMDQIYVFMSNHQSLFDAPLMAAYIPNFMRGIEADNHFKWPIYGMFVKRVGNIPIDRTNVRSSLKSIDKGVEYLQNNTSMLIFPEGHRSEDGKVLPFKKLPFILVQKGKVGIVPIGIDGLYKLKNKNSPWVNLTTCRMKFGKIIPYEILQNMTLDEMMVYTQAEIERLVREIDN